MSGIYLHIPFCKQACSYCDFYFETSRKHRSGFVEKLLDEICYRGASGFFRGPVQTVYFGGGTPSRLTAHELSSILEGLDNAFNLKNATEITMEVNPDDLTPDYLEEIKNIGINRLSVGIQSFDPDLLKFMNRAHDRQQALKSLEMINAAGFKSWTADLIYGNPGQSLDALRDDIMQMLEFHPPHISAYSLTIEPHTRLGSMARKNLLTEPGDEEVAAHMDLTVELLGAAGIKRYEVSNFCRAGHESKHNSAYWNHSDYLGLGPSAHTFRWNDDGQSAVRWNNKPSLKIYMQHPPDGHPEGMETLDLETLAGERLLTGLRTIEGVPLMELSGRYRYELNHRQTEWLQGLKRDGFVHDLPDAVRLTDSGLKLADQITLKLITL